jgi:methionyl-tRNA synthetase
LVNKYGVEQSRYFMMREVIFGNDGDFSHAMMINRVNAELANNIGNLSQRTLSQIAKNCGGLVPTHGGFTDEDHALLKTCGSNLLEKARNECEKLQFSKYIEEVVQAANAANLYIDSQAPWTLKKTDIKRMETVLYVLAEAIRSIAILLQPVTPIAAGKMLDQLAVPENQRSFAHVGQGYALKSGTPLPAPAGVFPRIVEEAA